MTALVTCAKMEVHVLMVSTHIAADALLISRETIVNLMLMNVPRGNNLFKKLALNLLLKLFFSQAVSLSKRSNMHKLSRKLCVHLRKWMDRR